MKRRDEVAVGVLLTIAVSILVLGALWLARGGLSSGYPLYTRFAWGTNLKQGQPVLLAGVTVGYVSNVELRDDGYLDVMLRIDDNRKIPAGSVSQVRPVGIFGDASIALQPKLGPQTSYYQPGDTVPAGTPVPDIGDIMARTDSLARTVERMARAIEHDLVDAGALRDLQRTMRSTAQLSIQLQGIAAEQNRNLTSTLDAYRRAATSLDSVKIASTLANLQETSANTARLAASLDSNSVRLNRILGGVEGGQGTLGKLMSDTLLYRDIRNLVSNTDSLVTDFKAHPRKYINLSIF